jgi:hypothetical protein
VVNQLGAEFFWRDPYKNEVDAVIVREKPVPVEVKFGKVEMGGLLKFMERFGVKRGYLITPEAEEEHRKDGCTVSVLPAFKFLLPPRTVPRSGRLGLTPPETSGLNPIELTSPAQGYRRTNPPDTPYLSLHPDSSLLFQVLTPRETRGSGSVRQSYRCN